MKQQKEFYNRLGNAWTSVKTDFKQKHYVKKVYCPECLTDHEEGKHREGVRINER